MIRPALTALALVLTPVPAVAAQSAAADTARLDIARSIAARMLPEGTFQKVMGSVMEGVVTSVGDSMMELPIRSVAKLVGRQPDQVKAVGPARLRELVAIVDPAWQQRFEISNRVMGAEMGRLMTTVEPGLREAMAEAYAARFDVRQLRELDSFFATPTGREFAAQSMTMQAEPAFMDRMKTIVPQLMEAMPAILEKIQAATADLPKPRGADDLTVDEKQRIEQLLGTAPEKVKS